jgi:2-C-methyl-D-erythritol 4-phosphate cytidylyltransferase
MKYSIIVAGGSGSRMKSDMPKQFLSIVGKPIIIITLEKFLSVKDNTVILVLPKSSFEYWENLKSGFSKEIQNIQVVEGGKTRFQSVKNGLKAITADYGLVAVHDAVRPFVSVETIEKTFETALQLQSAVVYVDSKDSIRMITTNGNEAVDRTKIKIIQTPQTFDLKLLKEAYLLEEKSTFTDDASVFEDFGKIIHLVEGDYTNIKITTPEDIALAEFLMTF